MSVTTITLHLVPMNTVVDIQASSHTALQDMLPYFLTASGVASYPEYGHVRYEYESSWDNVHWEALNKEQSLQELGLYDGMYVRITKHVSYSSSLLEGPAWLHDRLPLFEEIRI